MQHGSRLLRMAAAVLAGCTNGSAPRQSAAMECRGAPPVAEALAPELADSGRIFRGQLLDGGRELLYFRKVSDDLQAGEDYRIVRSRLSPSGGWSAPEPLLVGGEHSDLYPIVSPDGQRLIFSSYRRAEGDTLASPSASLWWAARTGNGWSDPQPLDGAQAPGYYHSGPVFGPDGRLHFRRISPDWSTRTQMVIDLAPGVAEASGARPETAAEGWSDSIPGHYVWGSQPGADSTVMLVEVSAVDSAGRRGPSDLWVSIRHGGLWSAPQPLGAGVNDPRAVDNFATFSADGCELLWVRDFSAFHHVSLDSALAPAR